MIPFYISVYLYSRIHNHILSKEIVQHLFVRYFLLTTEIGVQLSQFFWVKQVFLVVVDDKIFGPL